MLVAVRASCLHKVREIFLRAETLESAVQISLRSVAVIVLETADKFRQAIYFYLPCKRES